MKNKIFFSVSLMLLMYNTFAQSDPSVYLDKAMEKLEVGDCDGAQKYYNVYKELAEKSVLSVEVLLADCGKEKIYKVGDYIAVRDEQYQVACVRDGGRHGLAIQNKGWKSIYGNSELFVEKKGIPTLEELRLIYANRDFLGLFDTYWSCTLDSEKTNRSVLAIDVYFYNIDFSTGKEKSSRMDYDGCVVLLIHRF